MNKLLTLAALALTATAVQAQSYDEILRLRAMNESVRGIRSTADGAHYTVVEEGTIRKYAYAEETPGTTLLPTTPDGFQITDYLLSPDEQSILVAEGAAPIYRRSYTTQYHLCDARGMRPILQEIGATRDASFSPDGQWIAFSSNNNLWLYSVAEDKPLAITDDGAWNRIINGTTDWVYEEEFGFTRAYAFSPDSRQIAYLRFDESAAPVFEMMRYDGRLYNEPFTFKYPKAGERNSTVELWVYDIATGNRTRIDTGSETDQYILMPGWTPDGRLYFMRRNRLQNLFEVILCEADGSQRVIYEERSPRYVEHVNASTITFLPKGRFIVREETTAGHMHLYLHDIDRGRIRPLTSGDWEVTEVAAVTDRYIYYLSTEASPLRRDLYRITLDGRRKQCLTSGDGFYAIAPSQGMKYYISTFSNATTPNRVEIRTGEGKLVRTLTTSEALRNELAATQRPSKEFITIPTERGDTLNAWILRPRDFDPAKQYPVLMTQYSGPGSQQVQDRWSLDWEDALVDAGYVVGCTDGRGTGFRGEEFKKCTYGQLGLREVEDQLSAARYLAAQPWIDASRIGIYGWSYGGFMALSCALKGDGLFKMAIAVAPVTSWRFYDTIYTEIYNGLPQENAAGYDDNSPLHFAERLNDAKTRLLIIHGTADDNVHFQNTMEMTRALNRVGKQYDMMVYPDQNHSMMPDDTRNVRQKMVEYTIEHL